MAQIGNDVAYLHKNRPVFAFLAENVTGVCKHSPHSTIHFLYIHRLYKSCSKELPQPNKPLNQALNPQGTSDPLAELTRHCTNVCAGDTAESIPLLYRKPRYRYQQSKSSIDRANVAIIPSSYESNFCMREEGLRRLTLENRWMGMGYWIRLESKL